MTFLQFFFLLLGMGIFAWTHPDLALALFLIAVSRLLWKWSS